MADGAQLVGAKCAILVHSRVSNERIAIAGFGAQMIRVEGNYDDSVAEASRVAATSGWTMVSDTSWPDYERISALVMQEYTVRVNETLRQLPEPPTHVLRPRAPAIRSRSPSPRPAASVPFGWTGSLLPLRGISRLSGQAAPFLHRC